MSVALAMTEKGLVCVSAVSICWKLERRTGCKTFSGAQFKTTLRRQEVSKCKYLRNELTAKFAKDTVGKRLTRAIYRYIKRRKPTHFKRSHLTSSSYYQSYFCKLHRSRYPPPPPTSFYQRFLDLLQDLFLWIFGFLWTKVIFVDSCKFRWIFEEKFSHFWTISGLFFFFPLQLCLGKK